MSVRSGHASLIGAATVKSFVSSIAESPFSCARPSLS
jgi:hypothetical protein